ncbi:MAG: hypothetical protein IJM33_03625 [Bacteroidales bacterium]|nr:hypothetical protein [Bacteroidales bacterium]MBR3413346.1 hypothetical protein [Bacteroidales bacterium]
MEAAGAVFLPAAGFRVGTDARDVGYYGDYWSSTPLDRSHVSRMMFYSNYLYATVGNSRYVGYSVRPVRDNN